jgi:hypothetical protein
VCGGGGESEKEKVLKGEIGSLAVTLFKI